MPRDVRTSFFLPPSGFAIKPLKVKLVAGEQKATEVGNQLFSFWFLKGGRPFVFYKMRSMDPLGWLCWPHRPLAGSQRQSRVSFWEAHDSLSPKHQVLALHLLVPPEVPFYPFFGGRVPY